MKNLKKILIIVLALVLLTATVAVSVLAADNTSYTGNVAMAKQKLTEASSYATDAEKSAALVELGAYIQTVDPSSQGFAEFANEFNNVTYTVAWNLLEVTNTIDANGTLDEKTAAYKALYAHIDGAAILDDYADATLTSRWENIKAIYSEKTFAVAEAWLAVAEADMTAANARALYAYIIEAPVVYGDLEGFESVIESYNAIAVKVINDALAAEASDAAGFNAVLAQCDATPVIDDYANSDVNAALTEFKKAFDAKLALAVSDKIALITDADTCQDNTKALVDVYAFVDAIPLFRPNSAEAKSIDTAINMKSYEIAQRYYAIMETVIGDPDSAEVPEFRKAVNALLVFLKDAPSIVYRQNYALSYGSLESAKALLEAVDTADLSTYAPIYAYMQATPVDPAAKGADEFYAAYEAKTAEVEAVILDKLAALKSEGLSPDEFSLQLESIMEISAYLQNTPVSLNVINTYNSKLHGFAETLKSNFDSVFTAFTDVKAGLDNHLAVCPIDETALAEGSGYAEFKENVAVANGYEAIKSITDLLCAGASSLDGKKTTLVDAINNIMVAALLDYDSLTAGGPDAIGIGELDVVQGMMQDLNDAETAASKALIYAEIYKYLKEYPINPNLDGYDLFLGDYESAAIEVTDYVISLIDAGKLNEARDYIVATPVSLRAVNAYNAEYLVVYREALVNALAAYETTSAELHKLLASPESTAAIASVDGLAEALDNYEAVEIIALTQAYNLIYLDDTNGVISVIPRGNAIRKLRAYLNSYPIADGVFGALELKADAEAASADYDAIIDKARTELDNQAPFEQYNYTAYNWLADWDDGFNSVTFHHSDNSTGKNTGTHWETVKDEKNGGYYWKTVLGNTTDSGTSWSSAFWGVTGIDSTRGIVLEFDLMSEGNINGLYFRRIEYPNRNSNSFFTIENNKVYKYVDGKKVATPLISDDIMTPGEWTHIIMVFYPDDQEIALYADYQFLGRWSCIAPDYTVFTELRVQGGEMNSSVCYDNVKLYQGTHFRIQDKFSSMTEDDKFRFYVDYMCNANYNPTARLTAYQEATRFYEIYAQNPDFADYIEKYHSVDIENDIILPTRLANLESLKALTSGISSYLANPALITSENSGEVQMSINIIDNFIATNAAYLDQASTEFTTILSNVNAVKTQIERCDTLLSFVKSLKYFDRAFSHAAKSRHYANATQLYDAGDFRNSSVRESLANDPSVIEFEKLINGDLSAADDAYVDVFEYYESCSAILGDQKVYENSGKIIDCLEFITEMDGYEKTESFYQANYDYISVYMNIIRDLVKSGNYDPAYPGVDAAIAEFREIDIYFYDVLQTEHEAALGELVNQYPLVDSYIEKLGICTAVANYLAENDVDTERAAIATLITRYTAYAVELESYKDDYASVLEQNTAYFINITVRMAAYVDYASLKALYDEGSKYYYEMNSDSEAAIGAIAVFEAYGKYLDTIEEATAMFIGYTDDLKRARNDGKVYEALVNCSAYVGAISEDVEGAEAAIKLYENKLAAYNEKYMICNAEIREANTVVCSLRTNAIAEIILSVIAKIFNR